MLVFYLLQSLHQLRMIVAADLVAGHQVLQIYPSKKVRNGEHVQLIREKTFPILICSFRERFQKQKKTTFHLVDVVELAAPLLHALHVRHDPAVLGPEQNTSPP